MLKRRQHKLQIQISAGGGVDDNGDPIPVYASSWSDPMPCRIVQDERMNSRIQADGSLRFYEYCVVLDDITTDFNNKTVRLLDETGSTIVERMVSSSYSGQVIQRIWL